MIEGVDIPAHREGATMQYEASEILINERTIQNTIARYTSKPVFVVTFQQIPGC